MSRGISNFELERVFKDVNNADINENFLGVFPLNKINRFVMFEKIMPNKKYPLSFLTRIRHICQVHIGGA